MCVCVCVKIPTFRALHFIQVDLKCMLPAPFGTRELLQKKSQMKGCGNFMWFGYMATASHPQLGMVMRKR